VFVLIFIVGLRREQILNYRIIGLITGQIQHLSFLDWAEIASSLLSGIFVLGGVVLIRRAKLTAYRMFERSILVSILLTQVSRSTKNSSPLCSDCFSTSPCCSRCAL
jgi:hypothetical protein